MLDVDTHELATVVLHREDPDWVTHPPHRHHSWRTQLRRDIRELWGMLPAHMRTVYAVLVAATLETAAVMLLNMLRLPVLAVFVLLFGTMAIALGVAVRFLGGAGMSREQG